jgi:polyisoprenoid-binding protein YceI
MKKTGILVLALAFISMSFNDPSKTFKDILKVDVSSSKITWKGYKPVGSHAGTISLQSGSIVIENNQIVGGFFTVDMNSIKDEDGNSKLEDHLKSADFFEVESFPNATFEIVKTENKEGKTFVTGVMTIKSVSKEITFPATVSETDSSFTLTSETFKINRAEFHVKYKSKTFFNDLKDKFVNDEFDLQVTIVAKK